MNILYEFEHRFLPNWAYTVPQFFNDLINNGEKMTLYNAAKNVYEKNQLEFPFKEEDFGGFHGRLDVDTSVIVMWLPQPQEAPMCYCSMIFMNTADNRIAFYTLEKGTDPITGKDMQFLCGWNEKGEHREYGAFYTEKFRPGDIFLIRFFYTVFRGLKDVRIPEQPKEQGENCRVLKCPACQKEIIFDASDLKDGEQLAILCGYCLRLYHLKYENNDFMILNKIKEG
ncbi:MAG: hypothetical protein K6A70_07710 [Erysipelotrichaceae bacterium]|nr:hypothetical protein [Erysipelotrichaceae bacterium]